MLFLPNLRTLTLLFFGSAYPAVKFDDPKKMFLDKISSCTIEIADGSNYGPGFKIEVVCAVQLDCAVFSWVFQGIRVGRFKQVWMAPSYYSWRFE